MSRRENRYQRRFNTRKEARRRKEEPFDSFDILADFDNLYFSFMKSRKNVSWKESVQKYRINVMKKVGHTRRALLDDKDIRKGFVDFKINERGKIRQIRSVHIEERVVQKCLCDYILSPIIRQSLIYDNGASLPAKGMSFSEKRLKRHLHQFYKEHKSNEGYVLTLDFSKYFDNIDHEILLNMLNDKITDPKVGRIIRDFVVAFDEKANGKGRSIGLGSQISQLCAIYYPNAMDHLVKEKFGIKGYGRYMDDAYLIHESKSHLKRCLAGIRRVCDGLKIVLNLRKTRIVKLKSGVVFLKGRYRLLENGKVLVTPSNNSASIRMKRKLRKLAKKVDSGEVEYYDVFLMYYSWRQNFIKRFSAYHRVEYIDKVFWESLLQHHESDNPPILGRDNRQLFPFKKVGITIRDRRDAFIAATKATLNLEQ
jgi:hypothetical protein